MIDSTTKSQILRGYIKVKRKTPPNKQDFSSLYIEEYRNRKDSKCEKNDFAVSTVFKCVKRLEKEEREAKP